MNLLVLTLLAVHQGEEFAIILPGVMLVGAFFVLRWANKNDQERGEDDTQLEDQLAPEERAVGLVLPKLRIDATTPGEVGVDDRQETSV